MFSGNHIYYQFIIVRKSSCISSVSGHRPTSSPLSGYRICRYDQFAAFNSDIFTLQTYLKLCVPPLLSAGTSASISAIFSYVSSRRDVSLDSTCSELATSCRHGCDGSWSGEYSSLKYYSIFKTRRPGVGRKMRQKFCVAIIHKRSFESECDGNLMSD